MADRQSKKQVTDQIWLNYFNRYLFERGIITEAERNKMAFKIHHECNAKLSGLK